MNATLKSREILKSYFRKGNIPTEGQFGELIDSVHNIQDDGKVGSDENGLSLYPSEKGRAVVTVCSGKPGQPGTDILWQFRPGEDGTLELRNKEDKPVLSFAQDRTVIVHGNLRTGGHLSTGGGEKENPEEEPPLTVEADGQWHDLPVEAAVMQGSAGCRVYRITVCYRNPRSSICSTCEAEASHSDGYQRKVRSARKHWWGWSGRIKIRWRMHKGQLRLQMKSKGTQRGTEQIFYRLDTLWNFSN